MIKVKLTASPDLKKLLAKVKDRRTMDRIRSKIAIELKNTTRARFFFSKDPLGRGWIPSRAALREHRRTLVKSGRLRDSIDSDVVGDNIEIGIPRATIYGKKFQLGEDGQEKREFLGVSEQDKKIIMKIIKDELNL